VTRPSALPLLALAGCAPSDGSYLLQTEAWSTTCSVGSGPYSVPANQYAIEVLVGADEVWLDDNHCQRQGYDYSCDDAPVVTALDGSGLDATVTIFRAWSGYWVDGDELTGRVDWTAHCAGADCFKVTAAGVELCGATWEYSAVAVEWAD
jgi:hypothetical protein